MERVAVCGRELECERIPALREGLPTLVFLHEGLGSAALWRDFPAAIARQTGCSALIYSRYGNGFSTVLESARAPSYMHDEGRATLPALLATLGIDDAVLVGHSDGASIALICAAEIPSVVRALVLEAPHVFVEELSVRSIAAIRKVYEAGDLRERMMRHHADVDATFYGWNDVWLSPSFRDWNVEAELAGVAAPALVVQGTNDEYGTLAQVEAIAHRVAAPVDRLLLAECGHAPHRDRRGLVEEAVAAWVARASRKTVVR
ncbi:MAG TPA: alpha/beta hydrolase [Candidatus Tumulicola sp.]|jgi:pimeloyl-ACP methyl ester carboxylesterase